MDFIICADFLAQLFALYLVRIDGLSCALFDELFCASKDKLNAWRAYTWPCTKPIQSCIGKRRNRCGNESNQFSWRSKLSTRRLKPTLRPVESRIWTSETGRLDSESLRFGTGIAARSEVRQVSLQLKFRGDPPLLHSIHFSSPPDRDKADDLQNRALPRAAATALLLLRSQRDLKLFRIRTKQPNGSLAHLYERFGPFLVYFRNRSATRTHWGPGNQNPLVPWDRGLPPPGFSFPASEA
jgi:hypothetical protein